MTENNLLLLPKRSTHILTSSKCFLCIGKTASLKLIRSESGLVILLVIILTFHYPGKLHPNAVLFSQFTCIYKGHKVKGSSCKRMTILSYSRYDVFSHYYPTTARGGQITPKTNTNITRYLYSKGPVRQVCLLLTNQLPK